VIFKVAAAAILDLLGACWDTRESAITTWWSLSLCQIWLKSMGSFENMTTLKFDVLGGFNPKIRSTINETPKRHTDARVFTLAPLDD